MKLSDPAGLKAPDKTHCTFSHSVKKNVKRQPP
jgi:hypothetical protein